MSDSTAVPMIADFLLARIAEDEAIAREAMHVVGDDLTDHRVGAWWAKDEHGRVYAGDWHRVVDGGAPSGHRNFANTAALSHIARHDPARVLAECEAKRRIVELEWHHLGEDDFGWGMEEAKRQILAILTLPYADHPDYREEWRS